MEKVEFNKNGVVVLKTNLSQNLFFKEIVKNIYTDLDKEINNGNINKFSGFIMGNLNVYPGDYGNQLLELLKSERIIIEKIEHVLGKKIDNYDISYGGNLSLPKKGKQLFHTDGKYNDEMNLVSIATEDINENNGPTEVCVETHLKDYDFNEFIFSKKKKKKLYADKGDIIIRKHNLWHRGTKNSSTKSRLLLSLLFFPKKSSSKIDFKKSKELKIYPNFFKNNLMGKLYEIIYVKFGFLIIFSKIIIALIKNIIKK